MLFLSSINDSNFSSFKHLSRESAVFSFATETKGDVEKLKKVGRDFNGRWGWMSKKSLNLLQR